MGGDNSAAMMARKDEATLGKREPSSGRRRLRYSGALNEPIIRPLGLLYQQGTEVGDKYLFNEQLGRINLLFEHYGIASSDRLRWHKLAFALALVHVPGFQLLDRSPKKGAPQKWSIETAKNFVRLIDQIRDEMIQKGKKGLITEAVDAAIKRGLVVGKKDPLVNRYHDARKLIRRVDRLAKRFPRLDDLPVGLRLPHRNSHH
jgi:hypothetical protein